MLVYLKIADTVFSLDYFKYENIDKDMFIITYLYKYLLEYLCKPQKTDYNIEFSRNERYIEKGKIISSGWYNHVYEFDNTVRFAFYQPKQKDLPYYYTYTVDIFNKWKNVKIVDYLTNEVRFSSTPCLGLAIGLYYYIASVLLRRSSFFIHGVALQYKGKGLVFSAASHVGKSTHTNFWSENFGAEILNGDSPIIKLVDGKPFIYGSPWCGTSDISVNKVVRLDAIVIVSRGTENKIRKLSKFEAVGYLFPYIKRPTWDAESANRCLDYCEIIINTISIYKLECLPNSDAAEVARRGIEELNEH